MFSSLDGVVDKIEKQIHRHKERTKDWRHRLSRRGVASQLSDDRELATMDLDVGDAPNDPVPFFSTPGKFAPKPMPVEVAIMQLQSSGDSLLLFLNAQTNQVNLVYEEDDGEYGWVEPQFA